MKIKAIPLAITVIVFVFGGIAVSDFFGVWHTESTKIPIKYTSGEFTGEYNPDDIRGSYTFADVSTTFELPVEDLKRAFGIAADTEASSFKNKDLEGLYGEALPDNQEIGNGSVKIFVALYKGLPIELDDETYLPQEAANIIKEHQPNLTEEQRIYLDTHSIDISNLLDNSAIITTTEEEHDEDEIKITGNTTFKEALDWGISKEVIEEVIGGTMPNPVMKIKDYCMEKEISFSTIKDTLQEKLESE